MRQQASAQFLKNILNFILHTAFTYSRYTIILAPNDEDNRPRDVTDTSRALVSFFYFTSIYFANIFYIQFLRTAATPPSWCPTTTITMLVTRQTRHEPWYFFLISYITYFFLVLSCNRTMTTTAGLDTCRALVFDFTYGYHNQCGTVQ